MGLFNTKEKRGIQESEKKCFFVILFLTLVIFLSGCSGVTTSKKLDAGFTVTGWEIINSLGYVEVYYTCLLYTSDAADEEDSVDLGGRRIIKKKKKKKK